MDVLQAADKGLIHSTPQTATVSYTSLSEDNQSDMV